MWLLKPTHKHIGQGTLSEYLDGQLQGRDLERVEQRLEACDACRLELEELRATVSMMRLLPMETPRRSFVMNAPPPEPARAPPALAPRVPNWVYAGAASVAALALAVTVSLDATGGLSSDPLRRDVAETALAPAPTPGQVTVTSGSTTEFESEFASSSGSEDVVTASPSLTAVAPAATTSDPTVREGAGGGVALEAGAPTMAAPAPLALPETADQEPEAIITGSAGDEPGSTAVAPDARGVAGDTTAAESQTAAETQTAKALTAEGPAPVPELTEPAIFEQGGSRTSIWWRVLEAAAGVLAAAFLAGLALRWRASHRDLA